MPDMPGCMIRPRTRADEHIRVAEIRERHLDEFEVVRQSTLDELFRIHDSLLRIDY
jgi:hypothetical protein